MRTSSPTYSPVIKPAGVVASALLTHLVQKLPLPLYVKVRGGDVLTVNAQAQDNGFAQVTLTGPATEVFSGEIRL